MLSRNYFPTDKKLVLILQHEFKGLWLVNTSRCIGHGYIETVSFIIQCANKSSRSSCRFCLNPLSILSL